MFILPLSAHHGQLEDWERVGKDDKCRSVAAIRVTVRHQRTKIGTIRRDERNAAQATEDESREDAKIEGCLKERNIVVTCSSSPCVWTVRKRGVTVPGKARPEESRIGLILHLQLPMEVFGMLIGPRWSINLPKRHFCSTGHGMPRDPRGSDNGAKTGSDDESARDQASVSRSRGTTELDGCR